LALATGVAPEVGRQAQQPKPANLNTGPLSGTQNILNIQPAIPIELNKD
jgi:hypothetical protein